MGDDELGVMTVDATVGPVGEGTAPEGFSLGNNSKYVGKFEGMTGIAPVSAFVPSANCTIKIDAFRTFSMFSLDCGGRLAICSAVNLGILAIMADGLTSI